MLLLLLFSCGKSTVAVEGVPERIDVVHIIDLGDFEAAFTRACEEEFPDNQVLIDICVEEKIAELIAVISQETP